VDNRQNGSCVLRAEAGHDRRNRDMNRTGAAHVTIPAITTSRAVARVPESVIVRIGTWAAPVQLMSRFR
jgi:hypothetical protein